MRRTLLLFTVAALVAVVMAVSASPAMADTLTGSLGSVSGFFDPATSSGGADLGQLGSASFSPTSLDLRKSSGG